MRDPRLVEIDFLMDLEREENLPLVVSDGGGASVSGKDPVQPYGTDPRRFREMIEGLFGEQLITGSAVWAEARRPRVVYLTHAGRRHLWNMRDALLRDPDLEPFGLRSAAAWERDLFVKLRWASRETPLSVIFLDLDNFGMVNKEHGHAIGNAVLRLVFQLVNSAVATRGTVYRCGGEEVGVLLPSVSFEEAKEIAKEIRSLVEREVHMQIEALKAPQTVSIGIAAFAGLLENDAVLAKVDGLMRAAKRGGKNRVEAA